jgi:hypothetical protein
VTQTFNDSVQILGTADAIQLRIAGSSGQTLPLQEWQDNAGNPLARLTNAGQFRIGSNIGGAADALIQANYNPSGSQPNSAWHAAGAISSGGTISAPTNWISHELQLAGTAGVTGLHNALYTKLTQSNSGASNNAELRGATVQVDNQTGSSGTPVGIATGVRALVNNANGGCQWHGWKH